MRESQSYSQGSLSHSRLVSRYATLTHLHKGSDAPVYSNPHQSMTTLLDRRSMGVQKQGWKREKRRYLAMVRRSSGDTDVSIMVPLCFGATDQAAREGKGVSRRDGIRGSFVKCRKQLKHVETLVRLPWWHVGNSSLEMSLRSSENELKSFSSIFKMFTFIKYTCC